MGLGHLSHRYFTEKSGKERKCLTFPDLNHRGLLWVSHISATFPTFSPLCTFSTFRTPFSPFFGRNRGLCASSALIKTVRNGQKLSENGRKGGKKGHHSAPHIPKETGNKAHHSAHHSDIKHRRKAHHSAHHSGLNQEERHTTLLIIRA